MTGPKDEKRSAGKSSVSKTIVAIAFVMALNLLCLILRPIEQVAPEKLSSAHTWEWWRTQSYLGELAPDVVLLGSSLMMIPISMVDADYAKQPIDAVHHAHSVYMQDTLSRALLPATCFNFALPGAMISDDYMVVRSLMKAEHRPRLIVIGITLRDFIESHIPCAAATPTFRYFQRFSNIDDLVSLSMPQFWQRQDYWQGKYNYIWSRRIDMQMAVSAAVAEALRAHINTGPPLVLEPKMTAVVSNLRSVAEEGDFVLKPNDHRLFEDNSNEYRTRFGNGNKALFAIELSFLDKLLFQARSQNVKVMLVNMPLTPMNMALMPAHSYEKYLAMVQELGTKYGADLLNLNDGKKFALADFQDTAHMNGGGGRKLIDAITAHIASQPALRLSLASPRQPAALLAGKRAGDL